MCFKSKNIKNVAIIILISQLDRLEKIYMVCQSNIILLYLSYACVIVSCLSRFSLLLYYRFLPYNE